MRLWLLRDKRARVFARTPHYESGEYYFFDPHSWQEIRQPALLVYEHLDWRPTQQDSTVPNSAQEDLARPTPPQLHAQQVQISQIPQRQQQPIAQPHQQQGFIGAPQQPARSAGSSAYDMVSVLRNDNDIISRPDNS